MAEKSDESTRAFLMHSKRMEQLEELGFEMKASENNVRYERTDVKVLGLDFVLGSSEEDWDEFVEFNSKEQ